MDPATLIGVIVGFLVIMVANIMEGGHPAAMFQLVPMLLVFGTTTLIGIAGNTIPDAKAAFRDAAKAMTAKILPADDALNTIVELTGKARREGLLSLEESLRDIDDEFLVRGITLAVDGTDPEDLRDIMEAEVRAHRNGNKTSVKFFSDMGAYAPTIGIIGTVMGLVHVLENLAEPSKLGHLIAGAFLATLWGVFSANVLWFPLSNRIKRINDLEAIRMDLIVEGVLAVQSGENPRMVTQKLRAMLPPAATKAAKDQDAA